MPRFAGVIFILGLSVASLSFDSTRFKTTIHRWAEKTMSELVFKVNGAASSLQQMSDKLQILQLNKVAEFDLRRQQYFDMCNETFSGDLNGASACINITGDIANMTSLFFYGYRLASNMSITLVDVLNELNKCPGQTFFNELSCYKNAFQDIQKDIETYSSQCSQFLQNTTIVLEEVEFDISKCFSDFETLSKGLETNIQLCEQKL